MIPRVSCSFLGVKSCAQIIQKGLSLGVDYSLTTTCYQADNNGDACGFCDACEYRKLGFKEAGVPDPVVCG
jgi:7-cyano-7-deazaguanine synthase